MNYLLQSMEPKERFDILLSLTKISSESVVGALHDHLVAGFSEQESCALNNTTQSNFNRSLAILNDVAEKVEKIKEIDFYKSVK